MSDIPTIQETTMLEGRGESESAEREVPSPVRRIVATIVDVFVVLAVLTVLQLAVIQYDQILGERLWAFESMLADWVALLLFFVLNLFALLSNGQTIGKSVTGLRIVNAIDSERMSIFRLIVMRYLWIIPLLAVTSLCPKLTRDLLITMILSIEFLWGMSNKNQRCLHDYLAGTQVVRVK